MRTFNGVSPGIAEARHRQSATLDDMTKRKIHKNGNYKEFKSFLQERGSTCKFHSLKFVLFLIICGTFLTFYHSPAMHPNEVSQHFHHNSWIWDWTTTDTRYVSNIDLEWVEISKAIDNLNNKSELRVGLLNFNSAEITYWQQLLAGAHYSVIHLECAHKNITWDILYPEWIDEEEEYEVPACPSLPEPVVLKPQFNLIVVKLPCNKSGEWSREVARLHLQISAAKLAAATAEGHGPIHVMFLTECFPVPNLFPCKDLVVHQWNMWLYKPNLRILKEKVQLPIGSCELAVPFKATARLYTESAHREAYATILHSAHVYVCGAIAVAQSIRMSGSTRDLVILVDETISAHHIGGLEAAGWMVRMIQRIRNPKAERDAYNEWNYSKFRLWQLTDYDKIIFIDADLLILRKIDFLFAMPQISATGNNGTLFNSGVMVIEPSNCTFNLLMDHINEIESYNGGDQGYLNEIFTWWHRIPNHMNFLKHFWEGDEEEKKQMKTRLFGASPPVLYVLHYLGLKPWLCFRDYDCNWNVDTLHEYASDAAHETWWKVHDRMPERLQEFCLLRSKQKAALEWDRRQAEKSNFADGHWKRKIKDKRLKVCFEKFCYWESMLWHWGETNWTSSSSSSSNSSPPALPTRNISSS